ncbi:Oidioi.mRNA.OKI2018_I69.XSR.g15964.t1.cds [Oikopleura dioica]|uniref:Oidioi.mRNA.OKI2018_I69.XSR.g15964.t1.cds n=1 Tax=Oikopleura dioica TaxID=34765 RepID=A0ABN7SEG8_OIKDI|nr:Oidioi.mRNA.OKI2018_I69.XSR.g15964.t1.cds [Oikopleura dioica]
MFRLTSRASSRSACSSVEARLEKLKGGSVDFQVNKNIGYIRINNPKKFNALTGRNGFERRILLWKKLKNGTRKRRQLFRNAPTATDLRIAAPEAKLATVHKNLALQPGWAGATRLVRLVGAQNALYMLSTAKVFNAQELVDIGFCVPEIIEDIEVKD